MKNTKLQIYLFLNQNAINCTTERQTSPVCGIPVYIYLYEFQNMVGVMVAMVLMRNRLVVENGGGV